MPRSQRQGKRASNSRKQARAVRTAPQSAVADTPVAASDGASAAAVTPIRTTKPYRAGRKATPARPAAVAYTLPREQEYAFIREDLVRLLITSGILTVVMIALLFVVDR
jgi:hypothetical protein